MELLNAYNQTKDLAKLTAAVNALPDTAAEKPVLLAIIGGEYVTKFNFGAAEAHLTASINIRPTGVALYNMGYLRETTVRGVKEVGAPDTSALETEMVKYYLITLELKMYQAANQLGAFYMDRPPHPLLERTPEEYLQLAADKGIVQAFNNLMTMHKNTDPKKCHVVMLKKYAATKNPLDFMECLVYMLNHGMYADYCKIMKAMGNKVDLRSIMGGAVTTSECPICYEQRDCITLNCSHSMCNDCMFNVFTAENAVCPFCRKKL